MDEQTVIEICNSYFNNLGFILKGQPNNGDITILGGDIKVDIQGWIKDINGEQNIIWIEAKGSNIALKELLSDYVSLLLTIYEYGGQAILAVPNDSYKKIIQHEEFLEILQNNVSKGIVQILNVEKINESKVTSQTNLFRDMPTHLNPSLI